MKLGENTGKMKRSADACKIVGVITILWIIKVITFLVQPVNSTEEETSSHTFDDIQEETAQPSLPDVPLVGVPEIESTTLTEESTEVESTVYVELSDSEIHALACLIWLEGRGESIECQEAIASVVINRYTTASEKYKSLFDVMYEPSQFSPAHRIPNTTPSEIQLDIATKIATYGPTIPEYVTYFRADYYHEWEDQVPYCSMSSTYFSYDIKLKQKIEGERK